MTTETPKVTLTGLEAGGWLASVTVGPVTYAGIAAAPELALLHLAERLAGALEHERTPVEAPPAGPITTDGLVRQCRAHHQPIAEQHLPVRCTLPEGHAGDHVNGAESWPRVGVRARSQCAEANEYGRCVLDAGHSALHLAENNSVWSWFA